MMEGVTEPTDRTRGPRCSPATTGIEHSPRATSSSTTSWSGYVGSRFSFGEERAAGYDEDGFLASLTAEGIRMDSGETIRIHANDHPPPHVHVQRPVTRDIKINLETGVSSVRCPEM